MTGSNQPLGAYYCEICRLFENDTTKEIYHCPYCNVCRLGKFDLKDK
jgi:DNA-directed RNA polymerase subunit RPC12/RpoP